MDSYEKLMEKLVNLPFRSPRTESKVEIEILKRLMTPEEAEIACNLSPKPQTAETIAQRMGMDTEDLRKALETLVEKRAIFKEFAEEPRYALTAFLPGIWEWQVGRMSPEDVNRWEQYWQEGLARDLLTNKTPVIRVVPVSKSIPAELNVFAYEEAEKLIDEAATVTLADCICRHSKKIIGEGCDAPAKDTCIILDGWSDFYANTKIGRRATKEEAKEILAMAREIGLVQTAFNVQKGPVFICNCCGCCCGSLRAINELKIPTALAKSNFIAEISEDACTGCGMCIERCHVHALEIVAGVAHLSKERCIGCGVCVASCEFEAITMIRKDGAAPPPADVREFMALHVAGRTTE
ncbi:MAG: ATP-binding protein [Syntrophobacteraceae bacterium]